MSDEDLAVFQSVSFLQRCSALRDRLMQIRGFPHYFSLANPDHSQSIDPIIQLWDLFSLGIPLCYIFDLLPEEDGFPKINYSEFNPDTNPNRVKTRAIVLFAMQLRTDNFRQKIPDSEPFTVTDLWDRNSTGGFLKVVDTVTAIINYLPSDAFEGSVPPLPMSRRLLALRANPTNNPKPATHPTKTQENIIRELVETERKYGKDIELMHKYATVLSQSNWIDDDTRLALFPNINELFNFQRKFLIRIGGTAELAWQDQNWGQHFLEAEKEFSEVYAPYCANYVNSSEFVVTDEVQQKLAPLNHLINVKSELPAFIKKPGGRVNKYPLLLDSLLRASSAANYQHYDALTKGLEASKRVTDSTNEAQRRADIEQTVKSLQTRVADWKGHNINDFGELFLYDHFVVNKSAVDREYDVFLFEKMLLLCKKVSKDPPNHWSFFSVARNTPLVLKGRIFVSNVTQAVPSSEKDSDASTPYERRYPLTVWWKGEDLERDSFILRCRQEGQLKMWESKINGLIRSSGQGSQPNDGSGGFDVNEQPQTLAATLSRGGGPPPEIRDLDAGSPTPAGDNLPSDCQPGLQTEPNDTNPALTVVKVKVHVNEDMFVLRVPWTIDYDGLVEKITHKLRLLGPLPEEPVRLKYRDQEGDMVAVNSSEDVQMALEECQPGGRLTVYVR
ncbi:Dbl homology domain-containing protein [Mycena galopus ATCC 62051]|nr:Dbl homology domain-containing protein [Mycena galopus ATCC 62051]